MRGEKKGLSAEARRAKAEKTAYPAPLKNTGDDACALSYPSLQGEGRRQRVRAERGPMTSSAPGWGLLAIRPHPPLANARDSLPRKRGRDKKDYLAV